MSAMNSTRHTILGHSLLTLSMNFRKTLSHINSHGIPQGCALWISPCSAIYTVGMKNPVDIIFLDRDGRIVKMFRNFPPDCFAASVPEAVGALELPANRLKETKSFLGDTVKLSPG